MLMRVNRARSGAGRRGGLRRGEIGAVVVTDFSGETAIKVVSGDRRGPNG